MRFRTLAARAIAAAFGLAVPWAACGETSAAHQTAGCAGGDPRERNEEPCAAC